jgi:nicotinamidase-related amidase/type 1 glutamine amidotransferase
MNDTPDRPAPAGASTNAATLGRSSMFARRGYLTLLAAALGSFALAAHGAGSPLRAAEPAAPDALNLVLRDRVPAQADAGRYEVRQRPQRWDPRQTAIIVCDMWDLHHCKRAVERVQEMAPRMNEVLSRARDQGVLIIHAPSDCMAAYEKTPMRQRARSAPPARNLPKDIASWCRQIPAEEKGRYPIDQSDGGEDDEPAEHAAWAAHLSELGRNPKAPWKREIDVLQMHDQDAVSDSGVEIWNLLEQRGIRNVILLGVHTNMCVLGRPFGLRQMAKNGKNVVLMRDLTDTMYNPARWPHVSHFRGTDLIVQHVEKFVCPTITSDQVLGGKSLRFKHDVRPRVVLAISEDEYQTARTLPAFAAAVLQDQLGLDTTVLLGDPKDPDVIPGLAEALAKADLLILSLRRRALPEKDLDAVRRYLAAGKPLVGIRTASHAFDARGKGPAGRAEWPKFDPEVLGGHYHGHHGVGPAVTVTVAPAAKDDPILAGVQAPLTGHGSLYKVSPLASSATPLLIGTIPDQPPEPVAWTNTYGKARIFYTSLGHPDDFKDAPFVRLLGNAVAWALDRRAP